MSSLATSISVRRAALCDACRPIADTEMGDIKMIEKTRKPWMQPGRKAEKERDFCENEALEIMRD